MDGYIGLDDIFMAALWQGEANMKKLALAQQAELLRPRGAGWRTTLANLFGNLSQIRKA